MTTVCYRDGVLAADKRMLLNDWIQSDAVTKVWILGDGRLVAGTHDLAAITSFVRALQDPQRYSRPSLENARIIIVSADGSEIEIHEEHGHFVLPGGDNFYAWGSGAPAAQAALLMGATASAAVAIAIKIDPGSGGGVDTVRLRGVTGG